MAGSLVDPLVKLSRAKHHLLTIENELLGGQRVHHRPLRVEAHRDGFEYRFYLGALPPFDADAWSTVVGDCLFNLRSALDQLAYQMHIRAFRGRVPQDAAEDSAFPLWSVRRRDPPDKWRPIKRLAKRERTAIKHLQPFNQRNDRWFLQRNNLGLLDYLNRIDKHRHLNIARPLNYAVTFPTIFPTDCGFNVQPFWGPFESHAEVYRWTFQNFVPSNVAEQVQMNRHSNEVVVIADGPTVVPALSICESMFNAVLDVMTRFAPLFPAVVLPSRSGL